MKVAVVGLGYVGTVTAACLAFHGHEVWGVDVDAGKIDEICAGRSPVAEPGLDALVARTVANGTLHATTSYIDALEGTDVSLVCVGTPSTARGGTDLSYIRRAVDDVVAAARIVRPPASGRHSLVIRSTVPPGTVDEVVIPAVLSGLSGTERIIGVAMCPEFLREGSGVADFFSPPSVIVGTSDASVAQSVSALFGFYPQPVQVVGVRTAEALKYACNAFHATKVSFTNELGRLFRSWAWTPGRSCTCSARIRPQYVAELSVARDSPSAGPVCRRTCRSLLYLARMNGVDLPMLAGTLATNELMISDVVNRVVEHDARHGRAARPQLQDEQRRPAREPERGTGRDPDRQGIRGADLRPRRRPSRLIGANRQYVESKLPHLQRLLSATEPQPRR